MQAVRRIEREFDEPIRDVIDGFSKMGFSKPRIAEALDVTEPSLRWFCHQQKIRTRGYPNHHADIRGRPGKIIEHEGVSLSISGWARKLNVAPCTIQKRLRTRGAPC